MIGPHPHTHLVHCLVGLVSLAPATSLSSKREAGICTTTWRDIQPIGCETLGLVGHNWFLGVMETMEQQPMDGVLGTHLIEERNAS